MRGKREEGKKRRWEREKRQIGWKERRRERGRRREGEGI